MARIFVCTLILGMVMAMKESEDSLARSGKVFVPHSKVTNTGRVQNIPTAVRVGDEWIVTLTKPEEVVFDCSRGSHARLDQQVTKYIKMGTFTVPSGCRVSGESFVLPELSISVAPVMKLVSSKSHLSSLNDILDKIEKLFLRDGDHSAALPTSKETSVLLERVSVRTQLKEREEC